MPVALPTQDLETLATWGTEHLTSIIAIDSQSDEASETIPSTEGQRELVAALASFFGGLGYATRADAQSNLVVTVPARTPELAAAPTLALMCHIDTSEGTNAVPSLEVIPAWDGGRVAYSANDRLTVSAEHYASARHFVGEDVLHGPGDAPIGLDDKLGISELMTLAKILATNPQIPHGELRLVFRPDEEIGRMAAVEGLADTLVEEGVTRGYTIDGLEPFEINVENFNASRAHVRVPDAPLGLPSVHLARNLSLRVTGVKSHGATAKAEGYLNAIVVTARALGRLGDRDDVVLSGFRTDPLAETNADLDFILCGDDDGALEAAQAELLSAFEVELGPHTWRGAGVAVTSAVQVALDEPETRGGAQGAIAHVQRALSRASAGPQPMLSEQSEGYEGYSNPHAIHATADGYEVRWRLRDFDAEQLRAREAWVTGLARGAEPPLRVEVGQQYVNMGPAMVDYPELQTWAEDALAVLDVQPVRRPIRGGTGVDPFLARGIPIANLGTGYFAPESEKELTSRQNIARHALWLTALVQRVAG